MLDIHSGTWHAVVDALQTAISADRSRLEVPGSPERVCDHMRGRIELAKELLTLSVFDASCVENVPPQRQTGTIY